MTTRVSLRLNPLTVLVLLTAIGWSVHFPPVSAEDWPGWRGPRGDGTSREEHVPIEWDGSTGENIAWKVPIPGRGHASPIVGEDRLFLVTCLEDSQQRILLSLDRRTGRLLWQRTVITAPLETKHARNSFASSTPTTDGRTVFVTFLEVDGRTIPAPNVSHQRPVTPGRIVVAAYDFDGNQHWLARPGEFVSAHGFCSSPVLHEGLVIINGDHDGDSYLIALDKATGETVWNTPRRHKTRSYVTPIIREVEGRDQLILSGSRCIAGFDPRDGRRLWNIEGPCEQFVASMVDDGEQFYMAAGFPTHHVMAIRPGGKGDVTDTHVAWHVTDAACYVPSPVVVGRHLIVADDRGTANCYDTATGTRWWRARIGRNISGSLVTAQGFVYITSDDGTTKVIRPSKEFDLVAENTLGETCCTSPAISAGQLFFRGNEHLYAIGRAEHRTGQHREDRSAGSR